MFPLSSNSRWVSVIVALLAISSVGYAQTLISANGPTQSYGGGATVVSGYTADQATNSVLLLALAFDTNLSGASATFGGVSMTLLASNTRTAIYGLANPGASSGDIVLNTGPGAANTIVTYGTLTGVDTGSFPLSSANGSSFAAYTATMSSSLTGLSDGDFVLSVFNRNSFYGYSAISGGSLSTLNSYNGADAGPYSGGIFGGNVTSGDLTGGAYTPAMTFTGGTDGDSSIFASAVAFAAVPEPASLALVFGIVGLGCVVLRRRQARS